MPTHKQLNILAARWLLNQPSHNFVCIEKSIGKCIYDVLALDVRNKSKDPRISIAEIKVSRADLLQDLKKKKMLRYERQATHCYLVTTPEALLYSKRSASEILEDLTQKGLPKTWGVLVWDQEFICLRKPTRIKKAHPRTLTSLFYHCAITLSHRDIINKENANSTQLDPRPNNSS